VNYAVIEFPGTNEKESRDTVGNSRGNGCGGILGRARVILSRRFARILVPGTSEVVPQWKILDLDKHQQARITAKTSNLQPLMTTTGWNLERLEESRLRAYEYHHTEWGGVDEKTP